MFLTEYNYFFCLDGKAGQKDSKNSTNRSLDAGNISARSFVVITGF